MKVVVLSDYKFTFEIKEVSQFDLPTIYNLIGNGCDIFQEVPLVVGEWDRNPALAHVLKDVKILIDEEGKLKELPVVMTYYNDTLVGNVVFVHYTPGDAEYSGLTEKEIEAIQKLF